MTAPSSDFKPNPYIGWLPISKFILRTTYMTIKQSFESEIEKLLSAINQQDSLLRQLGLADDKFTRDTLIRDIIEISNRIRTAADQLDRLRYSL